MADPAEQLPVRVVIQNWALPQYRIAVFRELARTTGIDLKVVYGRTAGLPNVDPDGFEAVTTATWWWRTPVGDIAWV
jgi:hypothetical protein